MQRAPEYSDPEEIAGEVLFKTGKSLEARDFLSFSKCFALPCLVDSLDDLLIVNTEEGLRETFERVLSYYSKYQITSFARDIVEANYLTDDTIGYIHVTRLLRADGGAYRMPFPTYSIIRRYGLGTWKIINCTYAILDSDEHNAALTHSIAQSFDG